MNHRVEQLKQREQLLTAFLQTYDLLMQQMQADPANAGKILRLAIAMGYTGTGTPLQVMLEFNLNEASFQPMHSITTLKASPYDNRRPYLAINSDLAVPADEALSLSQH